MNGGTDQADLNKKVNAVLFGRDIKLGAPPAHGSCDISNIGKKEIEGGLIAQSLIDAQVEAREFAMIVEDLAAIASGSAYIEDVFALVVCFGHGRHSATLYNRHHSIACGRISEAEISN